MPTASSFLVPRGRGFAMHGIADGSYDLYATQGMPAPSLPNEIALSEIKRINVQGADITGIELTTRPLASLSGKVELQSSDTPECKGRRRPLLSETMVNIQRRRSTTDSDPLFFLRATDAITVPDKDGNVTWRNLFAGQYAFIPRFFARYWYLHSMTITNPDASSVKSSPSTQKIDAARRWTTIKDGERLGGLLITLAEGAASVRGRLLVAEDATLQTNLNVFVVPAEREKVDDVLRYFAVDVGADRTFAVDNMPPGRYWVLAQPRLEVQKQFNGLRSPDAGQERMKLRRAAELTKNEIELKPCQNLSEHQLPIK